MTIDGSTKERSRRRKDAQGKEKEMVCEEGKKEEGKEGQVGKEGRRGTDEQRRRNQSR